MNFNSELYQKLKESFNKKLVISHDKNDENDENENKMEEHDSNYDLLFYSKLDNLREIIIALFEKYNLKYSTSKSIEFAISQCRDEYLSISAAQTQKISELEKYKDEIQNRLNEENCDIENKLELQKEKHEIEIKQLKYKYEKSMKKLIEKTKQETKEEMEKEFDETVKNRARKAMGQIRDRQQKTIKSLTKKINEMQSEIQQLKHDRNLIETKKELEIEQYKSQISDIKQEYSQNKHDFDLLMKDCQSELNSLKLQNKDIIGENRERTMRDQQYMNKLQNEIQLKNDELNTLKSQLREQIKQLNINMTMIEKEHESKMLMKQKEHEKLMEDCKSRMQLVLEKKNAQNQRLKRLLEKTVTEYEKEKQQTQTMLNLRNEQLKELTNELQI